MDGFGAVPKKVEVFGVPKKGGVELVASKDWEEITSFIKSRVWYFPDLLDAADKNDSLLRDELPKNGGALMMGFDFHLTEAGPKLIEINTNAGGLATVFSFSSEDESSFLKVKFVGAVREEFERFRGPGAVLKTVAIVDDNAKDQKMFAETSHFASVLKAFGMDARVCSPEELTINPETKVLEFLEDGKCVDFLYNRLCDFLMREPLHAHIRESAVAGKVVLSPHPALYVRAADKRRLIDLCKKDAAECKVVPKTFMLGDKDLVFWQEHKKDYVFKPAQSFGSRGVYRGASISRNKIATLPPDTIVQEDCAPPVSTDDGTKFDLRVYTSDTMLLGLCSRHFELSIMEMRSGKSGFKQALPDGVCCFPMISDPDIMHQISALRKEWNDDKAAQLEHAIKQICHCEEDGNKTNACDEVLRKLEHRGE
jgi:hypothetical protein